MTSALKGPTIGDNIRRARINADLEQADLARSVGVSRNTISNWERGVSYPNIIEWRRIAAVTEAGFLYDLRVLPSDWDATNPDSDPRALPTHHGMWVPRYVGPDRRRHERNPFAAVLGQLDFELLR